MAKRNQKKKLRREKKTSLRNIGRSRKRLYSDRVINKIKKKEALHARKLKKKNRRVNTYDHKHTHTHTRGATVLFGFVMALQSQSKKALLHLIRLYIFFFPFVFALNREEMYLKKNKVLVWFKKWNGRQQKKNTQRLKERQ